MMASGSASLPAAAAISLRWNSASPGPGQLVSVIQPVTFCCPAAVSAYTLRSGRSGRPASCSQVTRPAFSSRDSVDVDLPGVHGVPGRAERLLQPGAELVPVGRLLGQHGQHDFLLHAPVLL